MKYKEIFVITLVIVFFFESCKPRKRSLPGEVAVQEELMIADAKFSQLSEEKGMKEAFKKYLDDSAVLLRPGNFPIRFKAEIDKFLNQENDTSFTLRWSPSYAFVSSGNDLGYTYGIYSLKPHRFDTMYYGTYTTIWKRNQMGKWKVILDSGNEGLTK